jgi:diguanylate cyclase (GGDEF)-like protein
MFGLATARPPILGAPTSQRSDRLVVRGGAAAWFLVTALLVAPGAVGAQPLLGLRWVVVCGLVAVGGLSVALPLERTPRGLQAAAAWLGIGMVLGVQLGFRSAASGTAMLVAFPLVWLAVRHSRRALLTGIVLTLVEALVAWQLIRPEGYAPVATGIAVLVALVMRGLGRQGDDALRFTSLAYTDFLTNCPNRRAWDREMPRLLAEAARRDRSLAVAVLDIDRFGAYNEDWGHAAGDRLLTDVATVLRFGQRSDPDAPGLSHIARIGADEFSLVIEGFTTSAASALVRGLEAELPAGCSVSVGIAFWNREELPGELLNRALRALGAAGRTSGGARMVVDEGAGSRAGSWLESVPAIVVRGEIESVYQPIRDLTTGLLIGYEALARPSGSPPDTEVEGMFAAARRLGISLELESLCQNAALAGAHRLLARGGSLFINVSIGALTEEGLQAMLGQLGAARLRPDQIVFEVNEQVTRLGRFADACAKYRRAGFRFAMDDVGEGLSTIEAIAVVRPEIIKIAKGLVSTADDPGSAAVIRGLVETARSLGGTIIAEGIESAEDGARMAALGATLGQGWALGAPARLREALVAARAEGHTGVGALVAELPPSSQPSAPQPEVSVFGAPSPTLASVRREPA